MAGETGIVYMRAGEAYARGDYTGALELYAALYGAPGEMSAKGSAISGLAMCLTALGRYDEARQYIDRARSQGAVVDRADQELRRYEAARAAVDDGVLGAEFAVVKQAAVDAFQRRDYAGAADLFRQLLDAPHAGDAEIAYNLGQCLLQLQDYDGARYHLQQADGQSTADINRRTQDLLQKLARLDDALAIVEPHLAP